MIGMIELITRFPSISQSLQLNREGENSDQLTITKEYRVTKVKPHHKKKKETVYMTESSLSHFLR